MTTIAIDKDLTIASDSQVTAGDRRELFPADKLFEIAGYRVGVCGRYTEALAFVDTLIDILERERVQQTTHVPIPQAVADRFDNFNALVITPDGEILCYEGSEFCMPVQAPVAVGSGADYAMAAMVCGKTADEAVEVAIKFDVFSGGDIQVLSVPEPEVEMSREDYSKLTKQELLDIVCGEEDNEQREDEH